MFKNIGRKIKGLAKGVFIAEVILIALAALIMLISYSMVLSRTQIASAIIGTLIIAAVWIFIAWLSVLVLYGFGELIDSNTKSESTLSSLQRWSSTSSAPPTRLSTEAYRMATAIRDTRTAIKQTRVTKLTPVIRVIRQTKAISKARLISKAAIRQTRTEQTISRRPIKLRRSKAIKATAKTPDSNVSFNMPFAHACMCKGLFCEKSQSVFALPRDSCYICYIVKNNFHKSRKVKRGGQHGRCK